MVDTTFIGHLLKRDDEPINSSNLELLISQEFYDAGKFKNKQLPKFAQNEELIKVYQLFCLIMFSNTKNKGV